MEAVEKEKRDFTRRTELELEFHRKIVALSDNLLLATLADSLFSLLSPMIREVLDKIGVTTDFGVMHRNIIRALRDSNVDEAVKQMRIHMALFIRNFELRK
ncbi:MAG: FCD domain-containing protein [Lentisphaeria bacterium]|nr:FCD domain-containing protein [Lentisphaeria bacterium]